MVPIVLGGEPELFKRWTGGLNEIANARERLLFRITGYNRPQRIGCLHEPLCHRALWAAREVYFAEFGHTLKGCVFRQGSLLPPVTEGRGEACEARERAYELPECRKVCKLDENRITPRVIAFGSPPNTQSCSSNARTVGKWDMTNSADCGLSKSHAIVRSSSVSKRGNTWVSLNMRWSSTQSSVSTMVILRTKRERDGVASRAAENFCSVSLESMVTLSKRWNWLAGRNARLVSAVAVSDARSLWRKSMTMSWISGGKTRTDWEEEAWDVVVAMVKFKDSLNGGVGVVGLVAGSSDPLNSRDGSVEVGGGL
jgi:hypothetical protein